jgi:thioredoxin 1
MSQNISSVNEQNFPTEVLNSPTPVLVDFQATWCGPCRMLAPVLEQIAGDYQGRLRFVKVDIDQSPGLASKYRITGVPSLLLFENGGVVDQIVGALPPQMLRERLDAALATEPACSR